MNIIDLTIPLAPGMGPAMFRKVLIAPFHTHEIHGRSNADLFMALHTATHMDAPHHFYPEGASIDRIPLDQLIGRGILFRLEKKAEPYYRFTVEDLLEAIGGNEDILRGNFAVVATGWSNRMFHEEPVYYRETPSLSREAAEWLVQAGAKAVVLDCATDASEAVPVAQQKCPVHKTFLKQGVIIVENCIDIVNIPEARNFYVYAIPLKIKNESGAPARVFAVLDA